MAASTRQALPVPQWRLINRLDAAVHPPARRVLERCDASVEDLLTLWEYEFVVGTLDGGQVDLGLLRLDRGLLDYFKNIRVSLAPAGERWVNENPSNRALLAVEDLTAGGLSAPLRAAALKAGVAPETVLLLASTQLVTITLRAVDPISLTVPMSLRMFRHLRVAMTAKGLGIVG